MSNLTDISMITKLLPVVKELTTNKDLLNAIIALSKIPCELRGLKVEATESGFNLSLDEIKTGVKEDEQSSLTPPPQ